MKHPNKNATGGMRIASGQELLEKLEYIDPALVAEADREPEKAPRRSWNLGTWIAVAACLCVLCLPLILRRAFVPATTTESGTAAGGEDGGMRKIWSGIVEEETDGGETWSGRVVDEETKSGDAGGTTKSTVEVLIEEADENDPGSWRKAYIPQSYIDAQPDGLPANEYFRYNCQEAESLWSDFTWEGEKDVSERSKFMSLPEMNALGYDPSPDIRIGCDENDEVDYVQVRWESLDSDKCVTVWFAREPVGDDGSAPENVIAYKQKYGETIVQRNDIEISALGGLHTDKALTFWKGNRWYRIHGNGAAGPEDLVTVLDWLLRSVDLGQLVTGSDACYTYLQDQPDAFAGYYPTDSRFVSKATEAVIQKDGDELLYLQMHYDPEETPLITFWYIETEKFEWMQNQQSVGWVEELSWGDLYDITQEQVYQEVENAYDELQSSGWEFPVEYIGTNFRWDGYYVICNWKFASSVEDAADRLWAFFQYLQSDEVKIERKIGDIVVLQPYASAVPVD